MSKPDHPTSGPVAPSTQSPRKTPEKAAPERPVESPPDKPAAEKTSERRLSKRQARRLARLAKLAEQSAKLPENLLRDPVGTAQKVMETLQAPRGLVFFWAVAMVLPILVYLIDLGAGSLYYGDDATLALLVRELSSGGFPSWASLGQAAGKMPPPSGAPLGLLQYWAVGKLFGISEASLRLIAALSALGSAILLLAIAIDVGVGRHAGGLAGLMLLALPLTYELSHRALPDFLIGVASTGAVALVSHSLHGHKFDRHILPYHKESEQPEPLPLRRLPVFFAALGIGAAALVDPRAGVVATSFALLDMLLSHPHLFKKRRVWGLMAGGIGATVLCAAINPLGVKAHLGWPGWPAVLASLKALWNTLWVQGDTFYARNIGKVVLVASGFGLLLGSLRRASRPLLAWVLVAAVVTRLGVHSAPPRDLGLVLPPLALCAAVGLQSPMRWLGSLGGLITAAALAGMFWVTVEGSPVLHKNDTVRQLTQSQLHAPKDAKLCVIGMPKSLSVLYANRPIEEYATVADLAAALRPGELFSCLLPQQLVPEVERVFAPKAPVKPGDKVDPGKLGTGGKDKPRRPPPPASTPAASAVAAAVAADELQIRSVLATTVDKEEPPPDVAGPKVVLMSR